MHVFDGLVVNLEEQIGAFSMTFRNRFPDSFFYCVFVDLGSILGVILEAFEHRFSMDILMDFWIGFGGVWGEPDLRS